MSFDLKKSFVFICFLQGLFFSPFLFAGSYYFADEPGWVENIKLPASEKLRHDNQSNGVDYLLVDKQWNINKEKRSKYQHISLRALNPSGVTEASQFSVNYDPDYESVILHKIVIHRDGTELDRKDRSQINLLQREKELEAQIYDGSKTLNVFIDDVRVGDVVEFSYTVTGANPIFSGHFSETLKMAWSVPVAHIHYRVLWFSKNNLHIRNHITGIKPAVKSYAQYTEFIWSQDQVDAVLVDKGVPNWYDPVPVIYLSDFNNWNDVVEWALPLYRPMINTPVQNEIINSIIENSDSQEQRVLKALLFVQEEVRYLGMEMGVRSHKPNAPDAVIEQRFGDCKDKSRLLVSLLQGMGIQANTALVNTYGDLQQKQPLPTPAVFDHAIVRATVNGRNYWLDPTRSYQRGNLDTVYQPDFDYALIISDQYSDLIKMSDDITAIHSKEVKETFDVKGPTKKTATYQILTTHEGYYAEKLRDELSETNLKQMQQSYLNYTAQYYPEIKKAGDIKVTDNTNTNTLTLNEQYTIQNIWEVSEDKRFVVASFYPFLILDQVKDVTSLIRTMPYAVAHPVRYQQTTRILLPEGSTFENEFSEVKDKAFYFSKKVNYSRDVLTLEYIYESLNDFVKPEDIQAYSKNINTVRNLSGFQIQMPNPDIKPWEDNLKFEDFNWPVIIAYILTFCISIFLSYKYIYLYDPAYRKPEEINSKLRGLSGWLILSGIFLLLDPIIILIESQSIIYVFSLQQWGIIEEQHGLGVLIMLTVSLMIRVVLVVAALFLAVLFFTARHTLPGLFIVYITFELVVEGGELLVMQLLSYPGIDGEASDISELLFLAIITLVWSLYFRKSKRVKATFTRQRASQENS